MIKKILCPTDFSSASLNAIEYAAKLAQRASATLTLLHIQPIYIGEGVSVYTGTDSEYLAQAKLAAQELEDICININKIFKVSCNHEIVSTVLNSVETTIAKESSRFDLTVIGTNGADNINQMYFGSHSYKVAQKESGMVIIVPEDCSYNENIHLAFASGFSKDDVLSLQHLKLFAATFNPAILAVHISENDDEVSKASFNTFCNTVEGVFNNEQDVTYERLINSNATEAIEKFVKETQVNMLAFYMQKHGLLYTLFHEDVIKTIASYPFIPMFIFHS